MTRTRIVHFTWRVSTGGGVPVVIRNLLQRLPADEFDQHVITVRPAYAEDGLDELPGTFHPLAVENPRSALGKLRIMRAARAAVDELEPDVLHTHSGTAWYTLPWALWSRRGPPRVLEVHDAPTRGRHGRTHARSSEWLEGLLMRRFGYTPLVHSTSVRDDVARVNKVSPGLIQLLPLGIETARFAPPAHDPSAWRKVHDIPLDAPLVSYMARLVSTKNIPLFIEVASRALRHHPDAVFAVVGGGSLEDELRAHVAESDLASQVRILGPTFGDNLVDAYHASDVFLSTSDHESFGLAIVEAMTSGLPIVATGVGGVRDLIEHGRSGFLAPVGDAGALAAHVERLLDDPTLRQHVGSAARERALARFDVQHLADGVEDLYRELAGS